MTLEGNEPVEMLWREQLTKFVLEQGGSYQDKKWQLEYYDEWKVIGLGDSVSKQKAHRSKEQSIKSLK